jgi:parallel beta-helix repeat protein
MKKGASTTIVMILVMLITVSLILMSYQWLLKYSPQTQEELEKNLPQKGGCLVIENINTSQVTVRNCGDKSLSNFVVYLDSEQIATYLGTLNSGGITQISYTGVINEGNHEIFISSNYAQTPKIIFNIPSLPVGPCDFYIYQSNMTNTYSVTQSNKLYCLAENININGKNAINFSSGVQNTILDCQGYNIDSNDTLNTWGVYLSGDNYNIIKNCNITDFERGVYLVSSSNNNLTNNNFSSNVRHSIYLWNSNYSSISNNNCTLTASDSIALYDSFNNIVSSNNISNAGEDGIFITGSSMYNLASNNYITTCTLHGLCIPASYNNFSNNYVSNSGIGINLWASSNFNIFDNTNAINNNWGAHISGNNNIIRGDSITGSTSYDYNVESASFTNNVINTNFTETRKINFGDSTSWFNYNNETTGNIWLKTNVTIATAVNRKLINWNQTLMKWNDTSSVATTARYNITGLSPSTNYRVYNNLVEISGSPIQTDSLGGLSFTINLPASQEHEIRVEKSTGQCNYPLFGNWDINSNVFCSNQLIIINGNITIFSGGNLTFKNVTLMINNTVELLNGINITSGGKMFIYDNDNQKTTTNDASNITNGPLYTYLHYFFYVSASSQFEMKNSFMSECGSSSGPNPWTDYAGLVIYSDNCYVLNNTFDSNYRAISLREVKNCLVSGNIVKNSQQYGILIVDYTGINQNNVISDNTLINNDENIHTCNGAKNNTITRNNISGGTYGIYLHAGALYNNYTYNNIAMSQYGIYANESSKNNSFIGNSIINDGGSNTYGIYMNNSGNNTIKDSNITDFYYGIYLNYSDNNKIVNTISNSSYEGIYLYNSDSNNITNTTARSNTDYGIYVSRYSSYNNLDKINAFSNNYGVYIECSSNNILSNSNIYNNGAWDLYTESCGVDSSCLNQITNVNGTENKPIYYHNGSAVNIIGWNNNVSEIILCNADGSKIDQVNLYRSGTPNNGILFVRTDNSVINNTNLTGYENSIRLYESNYNSISNTISTSSGTGFYIFSSNSNIFDKIKSYSSTYRGVDVEGSNNCKFSNSQWMNSSSTDIYVIPWSNTDCNLEITNVNGTENKPIYYHNGSAVNIIGWNNNVSEIILCNADGSKIDQVTLDRATGYPQNNMIALLRTDYSIINNTVVRDLYQGLFLRVSKNNIVDNLTSESHGGSGVHIYEDSDNNTIKNSLIRSNSGCGVGLGTASSTPNNNKNNIIYSSIYSNSNDYCISNGATDSSYFRGTNFTATRKIYLDTTSWFNYNNLTSGDLWLNTQTSLPTNLNRKLTSFTTSLVRWNDTTVSSLPRNMTYQITNLTTSRNYEVRDNNVPILGSPFPSGSSGIINFVIELPGSQEHEIKVTML